MDFQLMKKWGINLLYLFLQQMRYVCFKVHFKWEMYNVQITVTERQYMKWLVLQPTTRDQDQI